MLIRVWVSDAGKPIVKIDDMPAIYNVPHYRVGKLAQMANAYGKVIASAAGWECQFPEEYKEKIANWLLTIPNQHFTQS